MNSNQRSESNNQSNNGGNELDVSSARAGTADRGNLSQSRQSGTLHGGSAPQGPQGSRQSGERAGSQTDSGAQRQGEPQEHQPNDLTGGLPKSPAGHHLSADEKMNDDTGLSNTANRTPPELDQNCRQERQSNVGRRSDGTPD